MRRFILVANKQTKKLRVIPLGGVDEIGKNMTAIEYGEDIVIIDCGSIFPKEDMYGIDLVIPDFSYLERNRDKVKAFLITHGHEDHIGALPYVLKRIDAPIYCTSLTRALIEYKFKEHKINGAVINTIHPKDKVRIGKFEVEFIKTNHSIAGAVALAIHTPMGVIVHTGDFKVDFTPVDGEPIDLAKFAELGSKGVLLLMADSTNVEREGFTMSERSVGRALERFFDESEDRRIIVATFASNIHRIQQIVDLAAARGRKVCFLGRSMENVASIAMDIGEMNVPEGMLIEPERLEKVPYEEMVVITTGSQGEPMSGLARMASNDHTKIKLCQRDTVIISASAIPGNELMVSRVINNLFRKGVIVIYEALYEVHVSGHACKGELKLIHSLTKPKYFMPVHGEYRHLVQHAMLAASMGMPEENIFIPELGNALEITRRSAHMTGGIPAGSLLIDGLGIGDVGNIVMRDRRLLSQDGLMVVCVTFDSKTGELISGPDIISRGFVYVRESDQLIEEAKKVVLDYISGCEPSRHSDWGLIKNGLRSKLKDFLYTKTKRTPMILPILIEV
ncbi:MAG: ribonuclease J [Christensenellaceae bacterium]|nr:ribonuclease J [Christensenellaceae bacterium]PWL98294.1 MAG: ribonuclease J [Selenomonadales bacterium]